MKVLVFPRSPNPYQDELYAAMRSIAPLTTRTLGELTSSQTLNVLLLPIEILIGRARGARVLHLHWVYPFALVWARPRWARRLMRAWFHVVLVTAAWAGVRVIWTAHNLMPHEQVFDDDTAARRTLVRRCHAVIAHSAAAAAQVRRWGARDVAVIPGGMAAPATTPDRAAACDLTGLEPDRMRFVHFGVVREYKGVDTLLAAVASLLPGDSADCFPFELCQALLERRRDALAPHTTVREVPGTTRTVGAEDQSARSPDTTRTVGAQHQSAQSSDSASDDAGIDLVVVGDCPDDRLRAGLIASAAAIGRPQQVHLRFEHVSDDVLDAYLAASDVAVFPFRAVTNSSSVGRALAAGVPVIVPALATLDDVPDAAALRYDPADPVAGLADSIGQFVTMGRKRRAAMANAARVAAAQRTWQLAAERTWRVVERVVAAPAVEPARAGVLR